MKVFVVRAEYGTYTSQFLTNGYVGIGWFQNQIDSFQKDTIIQEYLRTYPDHKDATRHQNVGQIFRFLNDISIGDIVMTPYNDGRFIVGKVSSEPYFRRDNTTPYYYRVDVKWNESVILRHELSIQLQNTLGSSLTFFRVSQENEIYEKLGLATSTLKQKVSPSFSDQNIYEQIRNKFLELDATEFEELISYILRSLGFEARQKTGRVGDGGIDYEGVLSVLGFAEINLQVQVKRYEGAIIGEKEIRHFRGAVKTDFQGCYITLSDFNKKAVASAADEQKKPIRLINGRRLVEIFTTQYEEIMNAIVNDDNDNLALKLKFKKALIPE